MNILIIGNGFDLAHKLPTSYVDFLRYCENLVNTKEIDDTERAVDVYDFLEKNIWLKYFLSITPNLNDKKNLD